MGIRTYKDHEMLLPKFAFRENIRGGCVLFRPCLCSEQDKRARPLCPVHSIWPIIRDRTPVGERIFEGFPHCSDNRVIKIVMSKIGHLDGPKFPPHGFRRGSAQEIKDIGSTLSVIIRSGTWAHAGYRAYLDLQADYAINISSFIIDTIGSDSDDDKDQQQTKNQMEIRKKMKCIPIAFVDKDSNRAQSPNRPHTGQRWVSTWPLGVHGVEDVWSCYAIGFGTHRHIRFYDPNAITQDMDRVERYQ